MVACRDGRLSVHAEMVGCTLSLFAGVVYRTYEEHVVPVTTRVRCGGVSLQIRSQKNLWSCQVGACLRVCVARMRKRRCAMSKSKRL